MKKIKAITLIGFSSLIFMACGADDSEQSSSEETESETSVSGEINEAEDSTIGEFLTISEKSFKEIYRIDNFKIDMSSSNLNVFNSTDEKNSETGEEYKNVINGMGEFTYQDNIYRFSLLYSKTSEDSYKILFMDSNYNHDVGIDVPLESD